jgi:hypothetical protein
MRPTMKVVELQHQTHLLQTSGETQSSTGVQNYQWNDVTEE